jgi:UDP-N-acetylmuramoylalanine--D-glutamate ligase
MKPAVQLGGKRVLVVGLARTGVATALFCAERGARVTATEENPETHVAAAAAKLRDAGVVLELGGHQQETFLQQDIIIPSPGVPFGMPHLAAARSRGIPVWSEIELAWRFLRGRLVGITGSNGKTTTTALTGHILETAGYPTIVAGNIGTPLISRADTSSEVTMTVAELSSFQLENIAAFRPEIGLILNLTPDHLDRHASLEEYGRAKARLFENQTAQDGAVLNADDPQLALYVPRTPQVFHFSRRHAVEQGAYLRGEEIVFRQGGREIVLLRREAIGLRGDHNVENVLAASAAAYLLGADPAAIAEGVRTFAGVEHRLEFVAEISGVRFFNDSKATNVDATLKAIDAFSSRLFLILGGKDKGGDFALLVRPLRRHGSAVLAIGAASPKIQSQLDGKVPLVLAGEMERAIRLAFEQARPGDVVLLAPACASFDQFDNYEHRGRVFKQLVRELEREAVNHA